MTRHPLIADLPTSADRGQTVSIVRLDYDQWLVTNIDDPTITHHAVSLTDLLAAHRHAVAFRLEKQLTLRYLIGDQHTAERIEQIRAAGARIASLRRQANHAEARIRAERHALIRDLALLHVPAPEIAQILGVPTTAIPKDLTDGSMRPAGAGPGTGTEPERLF